MYLGKAFFPIHLAAFYPYEGSRLSAVQAGLCLLFLLGMSAVVWKLRCHAYLVAGWLWFLGTLIPMIGLVQVGDQSMADRYAYLPLIGIFLMVVWALADVAQVRGLGFAPCAALAGVVFVLLSVLTWRQVGVWKSSEDLWTHALQVTKDNYMAEDFVGAALLEKGYVSGGQRTSEEALVHFQNAARINPQDASAHLNLGADLHEHGRLPEAIEQYQLALRFAHDSHLVAKALIDLGAACQQMGDFDTARSDYRQALQIEPQNQAAFINLGKIRLLEMIVKLTASAAAHPTPNGYLQLGQLQQEAGRIDEARMSYQQALKLDSSFEDVRSALAAINPQKTE